MNPGVYLDMDRAQYDLLPYHNQSRLKKWMELGDLPSEFKYWQDHRHEEEDRECLLIGSALDCLLLESAGQFKERFSVAPRCDRRTKQGKVDWEEFSESVNGRAVLTKDQNETVTAMYLKLKDSLSVADVFQNCKKAVLIANIFGFDSKGEVDLWEERSEHIWDLKAIRDVSPQGFSKAFFDFGYNIQATFYLSLARALGLDKLVFNFVCVKNKAPYTVKVHSFAPFDNDDHGAIYAATCKEIEESIRELDRRIKSNDFEDDHDWRLIDIPTWRLPTWRLRQSQSEMEGA